MTLSQETPFSDRTISLTVSNDRAALYEELHSRPSPRLESPCLISHFALHRCGDERAHLEQLCRRFSVQPPSLDAVCFYQHFGGFELTWEKHTEFSTYTLVTPADSEHLFEETALKFLPRDWLSQLPGAVVAATHITVTGADTCFARERVVQVFEGMLTIGSRVQNAQAEILTSFRIHSDGFGRFIVRNLGLNPYQVGRLVQNLVEIETYRLFSLLGLPIAKALAPDIARLETALADINQRIAEQGDMQDDQEMLDELSTVAAQVEKYRSDTNYRFAATRAYFDLVLTRLHYLGEERLISTAAQPLTQLTLQEFLDRRLRPGVNTCNAIRERLEDLSRRVAQTSGLLRTRVELGIATQNQRLLASLDRRSKLQLKMQQAVEGFSVAAISYYMVGLVSYLLQALSETELFAFDKSIALGISVPVIVLLVWMSIRGFMRSVHRRQQDAAAEP